MIRQHLFAIRCKSIKRAEFCLKYKMVLINQLRLYVFSNIKDQRGMSLKSRYLNFPRVSNYGLTINNLVTFH